MPELPDVEVFKQYLDSTSLHQKIEAVKVQSGRILRGVSASRLRKTLRGDSFESTKRHGKYLFARLKGGSWVVFHFGMTGWFQYFKDPEKDTPHDRLRITFSNGYHLAYDSQRKLGRIELAEDPGTFIEDRGLGPDALLEGDLKDFRQLLGGKKSAIKSALMDQKTIAGLGNVYSDEILFQAGVHPPARAGRLGGEGIKKVFGKMKYVLEKAVEFRAEPGKFPKSRITPHRGKEGECPRCRGKINRTKVSGRTAYFCGNCQKTLA